MLNMKSYFSRMIVDMREAILEHGAKVLTILIAMGVAVAMFSGARLYHVVMTITTLSPSPNTSVEIIARTLSLCVALLTCYYLIVEYGRMREIMGRHKGWYEARQDVPELVNQLIHLSTKRQHEYDEITKALNIAHMAINPSVASPIIPATLETRRNARMPTVDDHTATQIG